MTAPKTLLELSGADLNPPKLAEACLVLIDIQNEYRAGPLALPDAEPAIALAAKLLARARNSGAAIFHIAHKGRAGSLFDRAADRGAIVAELAPLAGELVIEKELPNAFAGTDLQAQLAASGRKNIVLAGFMTHMCVSSTARAALDLGFSHDDRCRFLRHARSARRPRRNARRKDHSRGRVGRIVGSLRDHCARRCAKLTERS
ncbi:nicotinamidase-related amidase [Bradyrhizobium sp. LM3.2]